MITEHALLPVISGQEEKFEAAFSRAKPIIAAMPGFNGLTLSRCMERPNMYLLLVSWARLEDHTEGFRGSPEYQEWRTLLHPFYDPFPVVEHFETVSAVGLVVRPLADTLADTLDWERAKVGSGPYGAGLSDNEERELLASFGRRFDAEGEDNGPGDL